MTLQVRASSPVVRLLLETRFLRVIGRHLVHVYRATLPNGDVMNLRPEFDWDASTVEEVAVNNIYEKNFSVRPGDVVLDVGAHIGSFTIKAAREVGPSGRVISLEPSSENFRMLNLNIRDNHRTNVKALQVAAGSAVTTQRLNLYKRRGTNSLYERDLESRGSEEVHVVTVDSLVADLSLARLDFVKIDVEGLELEVLKGAKDALAKYRPFIAMETHSFGSPDEVVRLLKGLGYHVENTAYREGSGLGLLYANGR